jgi:hypothetical protein
MMNWWWSPRWSLVEDVVGLADRRQQHAPQVMFNDGALPDQRTRLAIQRTGSELAPAERCSERDPDVLVVWTVEAAPE